MFQTTNQMMIHQSINRRIYSGVAYFRQSHIPKSIESAGDDIPKSVDSADEIHLIDTYALDPSGI